MNTWKKTVKYHIIICLCCFLQLLTGIHAESIVLLGALSRRGLDCIMTLSKSTQQTFYLFIFFKFGSSFLGCVWWYMAPQLLCSVCEVVSNGVVVCIVGRLLVWFLGLGPVCVWSLDVPPESMKVMTVAG